MHAAGLACPPTAVFLSKASSRLTIVSHSRSHALQDLVLETRHFFYLHTCDLCVTPAVQPLLPPRCGTTLSHPQILRREGAAHRPNRWFADHSNGERQRCYITDTMCVQTNAGNRSPHTLCLQEYRIEPQAGIDLSSARNNFSPWVSFLSKPPRRAHLYITRATDRALFLCNACSRNAWYTPRARLCSYPNCSSELTHAQRSLLSSPRTQRVHSCSNSPSVRNHQRRSCSILPLNDWRHLQEQ